MARSLFHQRFDKTTTLRHCDHWSSHIYCFLMHISTRDKQNHLNTIWTDSDSGPARCQYWVYQRYKGLVLTFCQALNSQSEIRKSLYWSHGLKEEEPSATSIIDKTTKRKEKQEKENWEGANPSLQTKNHTSILKVVLIPIQCLIQYLLFYIWIQKGIECM